ncbi:MAG: helix-hairpin-helix domain-containing protein, partial [Bacteroidales bacterium]|nr:helix-hairpin-helix domain-containing protein [Bacteroidales bacterium]
VYAYESDVLYAFAVGGLSGKGIRTYLVGKIKLINKIQISGKIGFTFYDDRNEIGSGLETINGSWRGDAKLQIVWNI